MSRKPGAGEHPHHRRTAMPKALTRAGSVMNREEVPVGRQEPRCFAIELTRLDPTSSASGSSRDFAEALKQQAAESRAGNIAR